MKSDIKDFEVIEVDLDPLLDFQYCQISNHDFNFMLLSPEMKVLHSPFECKDYLQDIFWCEHNNKTSSVYGLRWEPGRLDKDAKRFRMVLSGGEVNLNTHAAHLKEFVNTFEAALKIEPSEVFLTKSPQMIVIEFDNDWTTNGPMLSAYTTLIRVCGSYKGGDVMDYLVKVDNGSITIPNYSKVEKSRLSTTLTRLNALLHGKRPDFLWSKTKSIQGAHSTGIVNFEQFPSVELE